MAAVRVHVEVYGGYELRLTEWCGSWQASLCPLSRNLPRPGELNLAAHSREGALEKAKWTIHQVLLARTQSCAPPGAGADCPIIRVG